MSRTDAHRPAWVWIQDHPDLRRERHDHTAGACALAGLTAAQATAVVAYRAPCWVDLSPDVPLCSCQLCHGGYTARLTHRARRTAERALLTAAAAGAAAEDLEQLEATVHATRRPRW